MEQQGDILITQITDGGNINIADGLVEMSPGLETAAYLSLFGGNEDDDGRKGSPLTWWGNLDEPDADRRYVSETQNLLQSVPLTSSNLRRIEEAAKRDLAWFVSAGVASKVAVVATAPGLNRVDLSVTIEAFGEESRFEFSENWKTATAFQDPPDFPGVASTTVGFLLLEDGGFLLQEDGTSLIELEQEG